MKRQAALLDLSRSLATDREAFQLEHIAQHAGASEGEVQVQLVDPVLSNNSIEDPDRVLAWVQCLHYCRFCS
jgi:hypothetical protein